MASFQVIFTGNEDELYKFVITWKMLTDLKKYEEMKKEMEHLEERVREMREELSRLDDTRKSLQREIAELTASREALRRETTPPTDVKINL
ncbi:hypothetical protein HRbin01_00016 [archaeon HR01]|nr:hypothetical protein HRbin01_00016 [archaeon HR01]